LEIGAAEAITARGRVSRLRSFVGRPELGSVIGLALLWGFFAVAARDSGFNTPEAAANYLNVAAYVGIVGAAVTLLMIAGQFDLSVGAMVGFASMVLAIGVTELGWPLWFALLATFAFAGAFGALTGWIVVKTGLPSFIVTLGGLFFLRGLSIVYSRTMVGRPLVGQVLEPIGGDPLLNLFSGKVLAIVDVSVLWWLALFVFTTYVLYSTPFGNWIFATGGSSAAARNLGVPVARVKIALFALTAVSAALLGTLQVLTFGSTDALRGEGKEFEGVITAVIGGALLHGGYGSTFGTVLGALTLGVVRQGLFFIGVEADWYQAILGILLLVATLINETVRVRMSEAPR
jgi:simple sugar transport system permease protein